MLLLRENNLSRGNNAGNQIGKNTQVIDSDEITIDHYKNLQYDLKEYKRVHIAGCFVLLFKVFKKEKFILFDKLGHHDDIYKR